jgi:hypothetical protein
MKLGKYKHFKGGIYHVVNIAKYSEDPNKEFAIYYHDGEPEKLWVRPVEMFDEIVERDGYKGPRFQYIG